LTKLKTLGLLVVDPDEDKEVEAFIRSKVKRPGDRDRL
jgi:hypothetical protein